MTISQFKIIEMKLLIQNSWFPFIHKNDYFCFSPSVWVVIPSDKPEMVIKLIKQKNQLNFNLKLN